MEFEIVVTKTAETDFDEAISYIAVSLANPGAASTLADEFEMALKQISDNLEKVNNLSADHLLTKIDESTFRNNLSYYRHILENEFETHNCFYCGRKLTSQNTHVDHFIPWSFLKADNTWNFVLSCNTCNIRKNDRLAGQPFLDALITRNNRIPRTFPGFQNYTENKLLDAYHWANNNGYTNIWMPA